MSAPIPPRPEDVTASWLAKALSTSGAETEVGAVAHEQLVHGAAAKLRVRLRYDANPRGLPETLWIKCGWEEHGPLMREMGVYAREALFYGELAAMTAVRAPRSWFSERDDQGGSVIILEDLVTRGAELWACTQPRSLDEVRSLLETLAALHAPFWQDPRLTRMPGVEVLVEAIGPKAAWPRQNGGQRLRDVVEGPRGALMPAYARAPERIERVFWRMVETLDRTNGRTLLHGDPHPGNAFSDADGGAGLYDWQAISRGPWAFDVAYAAITAVSVADRRHGERDLLAHYLSALTAGGVEDAPGFEEAWDDFRRYIAHALFIWPTNHTSHQAEENIRAMTERVAAAAADYRVFELWGA